MSESIAEKLDKMLEEDKDFTTRAGLRFMAELVRDAFRVLEKEKQRQETTDETQKSLETRITNIETTLNTFLAFRKAEQDKADDERKFYRRAVIGGLIAIALSELARWLLI